MSERDRLMDEMADLAAIETTLGARLSAIRRKKAKLKREALESDPGARMVTDHALLRFMERHKGIDVDALRDELRSLAQSAEPCKNKEHYWHESGVLMIVGSDGQVITVLSPEQAAKWAGRKLRNGTRIASAL